MAYVNKSYSEISFCVDTPHHDFYIYSDLKEVADKCNILGDEIVKCRTIGILQSLNGRFYLSDLNETEKHSEPIVQVSAVYLKSPPHSTVIPYPVQVFGTLQWKNRPVIFAKILQVLSVSTALRVKNALSGITSTHLAKAVPEYELVEDSYDSAFLQI
ncbi:hypothetical protein PYW08_013697 [Mythimna loreyi]|uniref:Uncharacterized protein n=2 Tax=Mythimna loreyi TaxID=667449 RepID=A0ACC2R806_9NEOP|nr:hypothetical protein PYW08_013696 [Mythimna loreyi]KAJ8734447.1 hypothetical protein PYW08_013697 [Mythimna loreyi]